MPNDEERERTEAIQKQGREAYALGFDLESCPLSLGLWDKTHWQHGWNLAKHKWQQRVSAALGTQVTLPPSL